MTLLSDEDRQEIARRPGETRIHPGTDVVDRAYRASDSVLLDAGYVRDGLPRLRYFENNDVLIQGRCTSIEAHTITLKYECVVAGSGEVSSLKIGDSTIIDAGAAR